MPSYKFVLSLSSENSNFSGPHTQFLRQLGALKRSCHKINFSPFTKDEFESYRKACSSLFPLESEVYGSLTNFNPLLLKEIAEVDEATSLVNEHVNMLMSDGMETLSMKKYVWAENHFSNNINMLIYALNGTELDYHSCYSAYRATWLHAESITYVKFCDKDENVFVLALNFQCDDISF